MFDGQDGMFHTPASSRIAPSPATSTQEEADSVSNASWPSTPVSCTVNIIFE